MKRFWIILPILLAGCETSTAWYYSHPQRKIVTIEDREISVVPRGKNEYDALDGADGLATSIPKLKQRQIKAVEKSTGCKVKSAEYMPGTYVLQTLVDC